VRDIKRYRQWTLCLIILLFSFKGLASESSLTQFLSATKTLKAKFEQRVLDDAGAVIDITSGHFYLSRPGKFRWDYLLTPLQPSQKFSEPVIGQQIVADGQSIYVYDPDLEQVTVRQFANALSQIPSLLLVYEGNDLNQYFTIEQASKEDEKGILWVSLKPKSEEASYQQLRIGLREGLLAAIYLLDGLGNQTHLQFSDVQTNIKLDPSLFIFKVPEGADVLSD